MKRIALSMLVLAVCSVAAGCSDGGGSDTDAAPTTTTEAAATTAPSGPPPGAVETGLRDLTSGQCFEPIDDLQVRDLAVWLVDCEAPHTHEVFDVVTYAGDGAGPGTPYPGTATVQDWAEQACFDRFEPFIGVRWTLSELDIEVWWPSEESWGRADRSVICTVVSDSGAPLTGTQRNTQR